jgi:hypothetical protein
MAKRFLSKIKAKEILPAAIGAAGVVYYAFRASSSRSTSGSFGSSDSPSDKHDYDKQIEEWLERGASFLGSRSDAEWEKRVRTGELLAAVALGAGGLIAKIAPDVMKRVKAVRKNK